MSLSEEEIAQLLKEDAERPTTTRTKKADITNMRLLNVWFKLNQHICLPDCEHRKQSPTGKACWNPNCKDVRPTTDRGTNVVCQVKTQWMCRYCFLSGWLN